MGLINGADSALAPLSVGSDFLVYIGANSSGEVAHPTNINQVTNAGFAITNTGGVLKVTHSNISTLFPNIGRYDRLTVQKSATDIIDADVLEVDATSITFVNPVNGLTFLPRSVTADANPDSDMWTVAYETFILMPRQTDVSKETSEQTATINIKGQLGNIQDQTSSISFQPETLVSRGITVTFNTAINNSPSSDSFDSKLIEFATNPTREPISFRLVFGADRYGDYGIGQVSVSGPSSTTPTEYPVYDWTIRLSGSPAFCAPIK